MANETRYDMRIRWRVKQRLKVAAVGRVRMTLNELCIFAEENYEIFRFLWVVFVLSQVVELRYFVRHLKEMLCSLTTKAPTTTPYLRHVPLAAAIIENVTASIATS